VALVEVRWTASFDLDGRPPKGYLYVAPAGSRTPEQVPVVNGTASMSLSPGDYTVTEKLAGAASVTYGLSVPANVAGPINLADYQIPDPGDNITLISRAEFDAVAAAVSAMNPPPPPFDQATPAATWTINHTLARYPEVTVLDAAGNVVLADVQHTSVAQIVITFGAPQIGKAVLQ
jgi:hypothetical protein